MSTPLSPSRPAGQATAAPPTLALAFLGLMAHTAWALYPVLSKRALAYLPPLSLLAVGYAVATLMAWFLARPHLRRSHLTDPNLWILSFVVVGRSVTNILSVKFTLAIYVQLLNLMTPFFVAILAWIVLRESVPPLTFRALLASTLGAALVIVQSPLNVAGLLTVISRDDLLGIGLALSSSIFLALYMLWTRRAANYKAIHPWVVFLQQCLSLVLVDGLISVLAGEDWTAWGRMPAEGWLFFVAILLVVMLGANLLQISALARLQAALFSSLIGWRMVVVLVAAALLLGERLVTPWQVGGLALVVVSVTWYLRRQVRRPRLRQPAEIP